MDMKNEALLQHELIGVQDDFEGGAEFVPTNHPGAAWFKDAGMGMFVHFGISSVFGACDLSWGMIEEYPWGGKVNTRPRPTPRQYYEVGMRNFTAENYEPEKWLTKAKELGCKYAVLTTKHHDGYTLWPSKYSKIGVQSALDGRDLVKPFVDACQKLGLKVGLYYSPPDWYYNYEYRNFTANKEKLKDIDLNARGPITEMPPEHAKKYAEKVRGEVFELLDRYHIDVLWFDGRGEFPKNWPDPFTPEEIRAKQPWILINPRFFGGGKVGDFVTPECRFPDAPPEGMWELCHQLSGGGWGYTVHPYKSLGWFTAMMSMTRAWKGNFLFNVGPDSAGQMPGDFYFRVKEIRAWMDKHREAVLDGAEGAGIEPRINTWLTTRDSGKVWYAHVLPGKKDAPRMSEVVITGCDAAPQTCVRLSDGKTMDYTFDGGVLTIPTEGCDNRFTEIFRIQW